MSDDLLDQLRGYGDHHRRHQEPVELAAILDRGNGDFPGSNSPTAAIPRARSRRVRTRVGHDDDVVSINLDGHPSSDLAATRDRRRVGVLTAAAVIAGLLVGFMVGRAPRSSPDVARSTEPVAPADAGTDNLIVDAPRPTTIERGSPPPVAPSISEDGSNRGGLLAAMAALDLPPASVGSGAAEAVDMSGASPTGGTPLPDVRGATLGDDGSGPLPFGVVNEVPESDRLNFLFEFCGWYGPECFRDAHFIPPDGGPFGSGGYTAGRPFHIRQGFVNDGTAPLGDGFDVAVYVTPLDVPGEFEGAAIGETVRYTSDYVVRGTTDRCGPTYRSQTTPVTCEWFVHEFADGLPEGRFAVWVMWEAPCRAWLEFGFTESCENPDAVSSMFTSGYDGPFHTGPPDYTEPNQVGLADEAAAALFDTTTRLVEEPVADHDSAPEGLVVDASGASPTGGTPLPDMGGAMPGDDGSGPLPLGVVNEVPAGDRLNFLFEFCGWYGPECFRDAHFMPPDAGQFGSGGFTAGRPFHIRHGFVNDGPAPLGDGFDVAVYVTPLDGAGEFKGASIGQTVRYTSDYVVRDSTDRCGPTYRSQTTRVTCEWFVHEFADGLPEGRFAIWAMWEAPCSAWLEFGFTQSCDDPDAVTSMFTSGYDGPFHTGPPDFTEHNEVGGLTG